MGNGLEVLDRNPVTIDGETYTIARVPDGSKLVLGVRSRILAQMKLDDLLSKLQLVAKLLFVAYNGVASEPVLRGEVWKLYDGYRKVCADSFEAMVAFDDQSTKMLSHLQNLFSYLLNGREAWVLLRLKQMGDVADAMATRATELAAAFEKLYLKAVEVGADAQVAKGTEEKKLQALEEQRVEFEALSEKAKTLAQEIAKSKAKLQQLYEEAKAAADKAENRAFTLELVGSIFGGLGQAVGGIATTVIALKSPMPLPVPAAPAAAPAPAPRTRPKKTGKDVDAAKAKAKEAQIAAEQAKAKAGGLKAEAVAAEAEFKEAEGKWRRLKAERDNAQLDLKSLKGESNPDAAKVKAAQTKVDQAQDKLDKAKEAIEAVMKKRGEAKTKFDEAEEKEKETAERYKLLAAGLRDVGDAISDTGDQVRDMGRGYAAIAAEYNQEKRDLLQKLLAEGEQEREALASIKQYAVLMEGLGQQKKVADLVIEALHQAVGALKQIVVILSNAADLWKRLARHCKSLSTGAGGLKEAIDLVKDDPDRLEYYQDEGFVMDAVTHYAEWKALQLISKEYAAAANKLKGEVEVDFQTNLRTEEMLDRAIKEGTALLSSANAGMNNIDANQKALREVLAATPR